VEASSLPSLSPWLQAADQWQEVLVLLPVLVGLELVLSADNAIALAAIARRLPEAEEQRQALNLGLLFALVFRIGLIVAARWVLAFPPLLAAGALYLLWLCGSHFLGGDGGGQGGGDETGADPAPHPPRGLAATALTLALADLAFSLDSVAAAVAVSDRLALVITGGVVGVLALRLSSGWVLRQLDRYPRLESAGYAAVGLVGVQLLLRLVLPRLDVPEWLLLAAVVLLVAWSLQGGPLQPGLDPAQEPPE
jgi:YkoY family integral membrane protein